MNKNTLSFIGLVFLASFCHLSSAQSMQLEGNTLSPVPGFQIGKVVFVEMKDLPPAVRIVASADAARNAPGANNFADVPDEAIAYLKNYRSKMEPPEMIRTNLTFKLADVSKGDFSTLRYMGAYPEGPTKNGPWSSVTRVFRGADGMLVNLTEWDYVGDGGGVIVVKDLMNTIVAATPARFMIKKSPSGERLSELVWITPAKHFTLSVLGETKLADQAAPDPAWMKMLAESVN